MRSTLFEMVPNIGACILEPVDSNVVSESSYDCHVRLLLITKLTVLFYVQSQKIRMLIRANELLRPEDFVDIARRFPRVSHLFGAPLQEAIRDMHDHLRGSSISSGWCDMVGDTAFDDALHLLLEKAKTRDPSKFASLVARLFGPGQSPVRPAITARACRNLFRNDALEIVNEWNLAQWDIPYDEDLASLEGFLTTP
jgi:hypothetical protein